MWLYGYWVSRCYWQLSEFVVIHRGAKSIYDLLLCINSLYFLVENWLSKDMFKKSGGWADDSKQSSLLVTMHYSNRSKLLSVIVYIVYSELI